MPCWLPSLRQRAREPLGGRLVVALLLGDRIGLPPGGNVLSDVEVVSDEWSAVASGNKPLTALTTMSLVESGAFTLVATNRDLCHPSSLRRHLILIVEHPRSAVAGRSDRRRDRTRSCSAVHSSEL
jgi:hypothetical protein